MEKLFGPSEKRLIVGLGNPGRDYEYTRHNLGYLVVQKIAKESRLKFSKSNFTEGLVAEGTIDERDVYLFMPTTFVNNSGLAVKAFITKKKVSVADLLIICDDINLDFGQLRIRANGTDGGHNGLKSISGHLHTKEFTRLRLGVGSPEGKEGMVDFVLSEFSSQEKKELESIISRAADCCRMWLTDGIAKTMSHFNKRKDDD